MRKTGIVRSLASTARRNATMGATRGLYQLMWGEKPKRSRGKTK